MPRLLPLVLLALASTLLLGGKCSGPEAVPLAELQKDILPAFSYELYCDTKGSLSGERSGVLLVYRSAHLERVYADAQTGNPRAQALFGELEQTVRRSGQMLASQAEGIACVSLPSCVVQWHNLMAGLLRCEGLATHSSREPSTSHVSISSTTERHSHLS